MKVGPRRYYSDPCYAHSTADLASMIAARLREDAGLPDAAPRTLDALRCALLLHVELQCVDAAEAHAAAKRSAETRPTA